MRSSVLWGAAVLVALGSGGCIVEDGGGTRGRAHGPSASVPDSGSPIRRDSAAETLDDAAPVPARTGDGATLEVEPGRTPPPPVR